MEFVVRTNADILADALTEHNIIAGDEGPYGIYVTHVNGMKADYEENQSFKKYIEKNSEICLTSF